jgi:N-acetylglucosaminyldiphosphoundecaprenol N-acetyl-beta-D-mannosaminyltransferase
LLIYPELSQIERAAWAPRLSPPSLIVGSRLTLTKITVLSSKIDEITLEEALETTSFWASKRESRTVLFCNVHSIITGHQDVSFHRVIAQADLVAPDGAPIAWAMRLFGATGQQRISGPDFMWCYMARAERLGQSIFLFGGTENTLLQFKQKLRANFPALRIAGILSPPFRPLTYEEDRDVIQTINDSGAHTVWVSLGCPKQERWMETHRGEVKSVMFGVGAAFDYHAGTLRRAPQWMQRSGLEWAYRLYRQPRALWRRYLVTNSRFIIGLVAEVIFRR